MNLPQFSQKFHIAVLNFLFLSFLFFFWSCSASFFLFFFLSCSSLSSDCLSLLLRVYLLLHHSFLVSSCSFCFKDFEAETKEQERKEGRKGSKESERESGEKGKKKKRRKKGKENPKGQENDVLVLLTLILAAAAQQQEHKTFFLFCGFMYFRSG